MRWFLRLKYISASVISRLADVFMLIVLPSSPVFDPIQSDRKRIKLKGKISWAKDKFLFFSLRLLSSIFHLLHHSRFSYLLNVDVVQKMASTQPSFFICKLWRKQKTNTFKEVFLSKSVATNCNRFYRESWTTVTESKRNSWMEGENLSLFLVSVDHFVLRKYKSAKSSSINFAHKFS